MDNDSVTASGLAQRLDELRRDDLHGASWVARRALEALADVAEDEEFDSSDELVERLLTAARELAQARPAASAVGAALGRVVATAQSTAQLGARRRRPHRRGRGDGARTAPRPGQGVDRRPAARTAPGRARAHALGLGDGARGARPC